MIFHGVELFQMYQQELLLVRKSRVWRRREV